MKNVPIWKGNDIGHGQRGGVLSVGAHDIKIGQEVPIGLLSESAVESLRDKKAIVDGVPDDQKPAASANQSADEQAAATLAIKEAKANLKSAKKVATAAKKTATDAEKSVKNQQAIVDKMADGADGKEKAEDVLQELLSGVETSQANSEAAVKAVDESENVLETAENHLADLNG